MDEAQDRLTRAHARLTGLRRHCDAEGASENLGGVAMFQAKYVEEFHDALDHLASCGFNVEEFRVKPEHLMGIYVDRALFLAKLDSVLTYFEIVTTPAERPKPQLGFHGPTR